MRHIMLLNLVHLISIAGLVSVSQALQISRPAIKDSTILRSTVSCPNCPERNCYKCLLGHENTLKANTGGLAYSRTLIGFQLPVLPSSSISSCGFQLPALTVLLNHPVNVTVSMASSSDWEDSTVNGENAPDSGPPFSTVSVPSLSNIGRLDITPACKAAAKDGQFSIYLGTEFGQIEVWSKDSGNAAILHIDTT